MAIQYSDTVFSDDMPLDQALARFRECLATGIPVQALHVGTPIELQQRRMRADLQAQIDELREKMENIEPPPRSDCLHMPTIDDIKRFSRD